VIAFADMVRIFLKGRRSDKVEGDILLRESLHQKLRRPLVAEFVSFLALKLGLLLHVGHRANTHCLPEQGQAALPSMSHQTGRSHLRALSVQFAQLLHNLR
jgi:hypothetical protein